MKGFLAAALFAFLLKLLLAWHTAGTNDALTWARDLAALRSAGFAELYRSGVQYAAPSGKLYPRQAFIHPPGTLHLLRALEWLEQRSGWPLRFWLRAACALADAAMLALVWLQCSKRVAGAALAMVALSPISILVSGFHANTDPIVLAFVVASVFLAERSRPAWAGIALGIAAGLKLVALLFAPAVLLWLPSARDRGRWLFAGAAAWIAIGLPYLAEQPALIIKTMLGYESAAGLWGFGLVPTLLAAPGGNALRIYAAAAKWTALAAAAWLPLWLRSRSVRAPLFAQCGWISLVFLFLSPGFGLQYLAWTIPWIVLLKPGCIAAYQGVAGVFLVAVYVGAGAPGGTADLLTPSNFPVLILMGLICWITIGAVAWRWAHLYTIVDSSARQPAQSRES